MSRLFLLYPKTRSKPMTQSFTGEEKYLQYLNPKK